MKYLINLCLAVIVVFPSCIAQDLTAYEKKIFVGEKGDTLPYRILFPENYNSPETYPVVLFLHGAGERGKDNELQLTHGATLFLEKENRKKYPAIVVFPQCPENVWWAGADEWLLEDGAFKFPFFEKPNPPMALTMELLKKLLKEESIWESSVRHGAFHGRLRHF